jgi:hypothetical protein
MVLLSSKINMKKERINENKKNKEKISTFG